MPQWGLSPGPDAQGRIRIEARRIYVFPTRYGMLYGIADILMLIGSLNYQSNLGLLFSFLFAGMGMVAILQTWRNLLRINLTGLAATPVFAGDAAGFRFKLSEADGRPRAGIRLAAEQQQSPPVDIPPAADSLLSLNIPTHARGELRIRRLKLFSRYPFGLLQAWAYCRPANHILVYPKPSAPVPLRASAHYVRSEKGDRGVGADDYVGPRQYRPGDPPRHIDWKAYAREKGLITRQFGGDRAERVWLDWDALPGDDRERRLSQLCRMVLDAHRDGMRYGLQLPGLTLEPGAGDAHRHHCLAALARFGDKHEKA